MIETATYSEFTLDFHNRLSGTRTPVSGSIEVSHRCPLNCRHCYNNLPMNDDAARAGEMTTSEHMRLVDEIVDEGCMWLLYTGGEIFARRDFLDIYTHAKRRGLLLTLFTNGILINERIADHLAEYRPFGMEITLYGATRETYEAMTRVPGSFDRCHRGIELLLARGIPLSLKTVATALTLSEVPAMRAFARDRGLDFTYDPMMHPRIDCGRSPLDVRLEPHEAVALDLLDPERESEWRRFNRIFAGPVVRPRESPEELYTCGGGVNAFAVDPAGGLSICVISHVDKYDVRKGSFKEGWNHFLKNVRAKKATRPTKCTNCHLIAMCGMCPANGELEHADPEKPVDFLCHVAHLRAHALEQGVPAHGDCEYCPGGARHDALKASVAALEAAVRRGESGSPKLWERRLDMARALDDEPAAASSGCGTGGGCAGCGPQKFTALTTLTTTRGTI